MLKKILLFLLLFMLLISCSFNNTEENLKDVIKYNQKKWQKQKIINCLKTTGNKSNKENARHVFFVALYYKQLCFIFI